MTTTNATAQGIYSNKNAVRLTISFHTTSALTDAAELTTFVMPCDGRIIGIDAWTSTAGATSGNSLIDVLVATGATSTTFASLYTTAANRPTIANVTTVGSFKTAALPDTRLLLKGDVVKIQAAVSSGTGVGGSGITCGTVSIGMP